LGDAIVPQTRRAAPTEFVLFFPAFPWHTSLSSFRFCSRGTSVRCTRPSLWLSKRKTYGNLSNGRGPRTELLTAGFNRRSLVAEHGARYRYSCGISPREVRLCRISSLPWGKGCCPDIPPQTKTRHKKDSLAQCFLHLRGDSDRGSCPTVIHVFCIYNFEIPFRNGLEQALLPSQLARSQPAPQHRFNRRPRQAAPRKPVVIVRLCARADQDSPSAGPSAVTAYRQKAVHSQRSASFRTAKYTRSFQGGVFLQTTLLFPKFCSAFTLGIFDCG